MPRAEYQHLPPRPTRRAGERMLAYYERVNKWEAEYKPLAARAARAIDASNKAPAITRTRYVSANQKLGHETIHDYAQKNPVLLALLRAKPELCN